MLPVASKVIATVNAPYGALVTAEQLAAKIADPASVSNFDPSVFAFLSEVSPKLQKEFISEMHVDKGKVAKVAKGFSSMAGYPLALCA